MSERVKSVNESGRVRMADDLTHLTIHPFNSSLQRR